MRVREGWRRVLGGNTHGVEMRKRLPLAPRFAARICCHSFAARICCQKYQLELPAEEATLHVRNVTPDRIVKDFVNEKHRSNYKSLK